MTWFAGAMARSMPLGWWPPSEFEQARHFLPGEFRSAAYSQAGIFSDGQAELRFATSTVAAILQG